MIPDTGNLQYDIDILIENAAKITLSPLGRQTFAMTIGSASNNPLFAPVFSW